MPEAGKCETRNELTITWRIHDFATMHDSNEFIKSPEFTGPEGHQWLLQLFPKASWDSRCMSLHLHLLSSQTLMANVTVGLFDIHGKRYFEKFITHEFDHSSGLLPFNMFVAWHEFDQFKDLLLPGDSLEVFCNIHVINVVHEFEYIWRILDCDSLWNCQWGEAIWSRAFADPIGETRWALELHPHLSPLDSHRSVSLFVNQVGGENVKANVCFASVDWISGKPCDSQWIRGRLFNCAKLNKTGWARYPGFLDFDQPNGVLELYCKIQILDETRGNATQLCQSSPPPTNKCQMVSSVASKEVTLLVGDDLIYVDRKMLMNASPVFAVMFGDARKERFVFHYVRPAIMHHVLYYLVVGTIDYLTSLDNLEELLVFADMMKSLFGECEEHLKRMITSKNIWRIFSIAKLYHGNLYMYIKSLFCFQRNKFILRPGCFEMIRKYPRVMDGFDEKHLLNLLNHLNR